jgi:cyclophilin family peptidyl-prolyl cis-trans isomerase
MLQARALLSFLLLFPSLQAFSEAPAIESTPQAKPKTKTSKKDSKMNTTVVIETSKGTLEAELFDDKTPITVANFLKYTDEKFFDNTIFHRVISGFMIQGGGFNADMNQKDTHPQIKNEASAELKNLKGTLAMARTSDIHSATSQFFINHADNDFLNHKGTGPQTFGYAVFGKITKGMDVVEAIAKVPTGTSGFHQDVPTEPVFIKSIRKK